MVGDRTARMLTCRIYFYSHTSLSKVYHFRSHFWGLSCLIFKASRFSLRWCIISLYMQVPHFSFTRLSVIFLPCQVVSLFAHTFEGRIVSSRKCHFSFTRWGSYCFIVEQCHISFTSLRVMLLHCQSVPFLVRALDWGLSRYSGDV